MSKIFLLKIVKKKSSPIEVFFLFQVLEIPRAPDPSEKEPQAEVRVFEIPQPEQKELEAAGSDLPPQALVWKS